MAEGWVVEGGVGLFHDDVFGNPDLRLESAWHYFAGLEYRLVSGSPYTPRTGSVYSVDRGSYQSVFGTANSERYPLFHQLDVRIDKRWIFDDWMLTRGSLARCRRLGLLSRPPRKRRWTGADPRGLVRG